MPRSYRCEFPWSRSDEHCSSVENFLLHSSCVLAISCRQPKPHEYFCSGNLLARPESPRPLDLQLGNPFHPPPSQPSAGAILRLMKFRVLQENLRKILWERIESGELTGLRLAQQTGFKQAHISNFLNRKRGLSIEGMDKVLSVQRLSVLDLLDPAEVNKRASILPPSSDEFENVLLTDPSTAATAPLIAADRVTDILKFKKAFLRKLKAEPQGDRSSWHRFVLIKLDPKDALATYPRLMAGATLLIHRHYNSLKPYRKGEFNMYAVLKNDTSTIRYVELVENQLILRPHSPTPPIEILEIPHGHTPADYLIGRIAQFSLEA